jgi:hypothetical protein
VGIFSMGSICFCCARWTAVRDKYTYSGDTVASATSLAAGSYQGAAAGNSTVGIFALGETGCGSGATTTRNKYTYSGCLNAAATASSAASRQGCAASNGISGVTV